jgi:serine/threonine-protein kinase
LAVVFRPDCGKTKGIAMKIEARDLPLVLSLLDQALDLSPEQQQAWLDDLPEPARAYRDALARMLDDHANEESTSFRGTLPRLRDSGPAAAPAPAPATAAAGRTIGPYRLITELGRGGMGTVWLAERSDGRPERQVALKLPHLGPGTKAFAGRLARERDILASLVHPNIARLHDAGISSEGQPYIALAYVQGRTLIDHCDALRLGLQQRIGLFLQVLEAVQFAHGQRVLHRDLKPSNVLVDGHGQVRLLDFGMAKLMIDGIADATELTLGNGSAMTLHYASPEQVAGIGLSTASDIYSLGVLLFRLLAGQMPYKLARGTVFQQHAAIIRAVPPPPSTVINDLVAAHFGLPARELSCALQGGLDGVVLRALQKKPADRHASADAMRLDLQRHLGG